MNKNEYKKKKQSSWNQVYNGKYQKLFLKTLKTLGKEKRNLAVSHANQDISAVNKCQEKKKKNFTPVTYKTEQSQETHPHVHSYLIYDKDAISVNEKNNELDLFSKWCLINWKFTWKKKWVLTTSSHFTQNIKIKPDGL